MSADHLLHATLSAEGYWTYRLECLSVGEHHSYVEKDGGCTCTCDDCIAGDHGGCGETDFPYVADLGYGCQLERVEVCWVHDWLDNVGQDAIFGNDWPEDVLPLPVNCEYNDGLEIHYAGTQR